MLATFLNLKCLNSTAFLDVTPCRLEEVGLFFPDEYLLNKLGACFLYVPCLAYRHLVHGASTFRRIIDRCVPDYTASHKS
jgi:hypothetical protein